MAGMPLLVVAGIPELAQALKGTGLFPDVLTPQSTRELVAAITSPQIAQCQAKDLVFVFADTLTQDDPNMPMSEILRRLTVSDYQVVIVPVTTRGAELQRQNPKSGLLPMPLTVNEALFAIGSFGYPVDPLPDGFTPITVTGQIPVQQPAAVAEHRANAPLEQPKVEGAEQQKQAVQNQPAASGWVVPDAHAPEHYQEERVAAPSAPDTPSARTPAAAEPYMAPGAHSSREDSPAAAVPIAPQPFAQPFTQPVPQTPSTTAFPTATPPAQPRPSLAPLAQPGAQTSGALLPPTGGGPGPVMRQDSGYVAVPSGQQRRGYTVTIAVSKGGVGKSSMTLNLAAFLGMRLRSQGKTVCVVDANYQQADSGKYLDTYTPNINTIVNNPSLLTPERILEALVHKPEYNLSVLLGPATPDEASPLAISPRLYNEILDLLRQRFDYVFIDTPVAEKFHDMFSKFALPRADYIIVPVAPNFTTLHNADNWLRAAVVAPKTMYGAGIDPNRVGVVLNRAEDGIGCSEEDVRHTMASWHFLGSIPETKEWKACNNRNELVAPRNYAELSQAFAEVLHAATGEPILLENLGQLGPDKKSGGIFKSMFRKKK